jgi:lysophospholipase L1-like esterase
MKFFAVFVAFLLMSFLPERQTKLRIFMAGDSTMSIKAKAAYPETGWGMPFVEFWNDQVQVVNRAKNGRSTKTFRSEGIWTNMLNEMEAGDYVFIQFGHNDEVPEKLGSFTTPAEFTINLKQYIAETRAKKAIPVLMTPVARRKFDATNIPVGTHDAYSALVRQVASTEQVVLIDHDSLSMAVYGKIGVESSKLLFLHLQPGEHPNYPAGKEDNTHFNELGARLMAQLVLQEIRLKIPELANYIYSIQNSKS